MKTNEKKSFDTVAFFRAIKEKLAARMEGMTLEQQKAFLEKIRKGDIRLT
jgi:hypothetical protein